MNYRLEAIELQGVKTFANNTKLEFPGKITAIVGPNGSGKSNISDAIRWVLGEQSFSLLRAKKTEDMIFSGSQQRSRSGMASTTITFNNHDGWLPIDYAHVTITRQAYRDGQNDYLLNGQKVRLKDINELLSQTGLSERNYSIIGQGLVDVTLSLKPDERRKLFEEAAGIGIYRSRKEESLRRLENTRKNLDRVLDILSEIKPRLKSLERQSERFQEHQRLQTELKALLKEWYGYQWRQKQGDLKNARITYQNYEVKLTGLRQKHIKTQKEVDEKHLFLQENRKILETAHSEQSENFKQLERTTRDLAILDERLQSNLRQKNNLLIDIAKLEEEIAEINTNEQEIFREIEQRQSDFTSAEVEARKMQKQLSELTTKSEIAEKELRTKRQSRIDFETKKVVSAARLEELKHRINSFNIEKEKIAAAIIVFNTDKNNAEINLKDLENQLIVLNKNWETSQAEHKKAIYDFETLKNEQDEISKQRSRVETQKTKIQTQLKLLQQAEIALSGYSEGSKNLLADSKKGKLPTGIEPLSRHIFVEENYEHAISAAMGELADLLIMPEKSKDYLIDYLESNGSERVALIDLETTKRTRLDRSILSSKGVVGFASDLIAVPEAYQMLVNNLFSDVLVVENAEVAQEIQKLFHTEIRIVTLSGIVFHPNGLLISGLSPTGKRISRTREQSQLENDLAEQINIDKRLIENENLFVDRANEVKQRLHELTSHISQLDKNIVETTRKAQSVKDSLTRMNEQLVWHRERLNDLQKNLDEATQQIELEKEDINNVNSQIKTLKLAEEQLVKTLNDLPLLEFQQSANHWQSQLVIAQTALKVAQQREQDHNVRKMASRDRFTVFHARLKEVDDHQKQTGQQKESLEALIDKIQSDISIIKHEKIEPLLAANSKFEQEIEKYKTSESNSYEKVSFAERQFTQLQLDLSRKQDQLDNLLERIQEDFGAVEYDQDQKFNSQTPLPFDEDFIEQLPALEELPATHTEEIKRLRIQIRQMGAINAEAQQEFNEVRERYDFLNNQVADLEQASEDLQEVITTLDEMMQNDFLKTYKEVNREFSQYFSRLFVGGEANLVFLDESNPIEGGIDIEARLPGKRQQGLASLSGGERSLTAVALIFALLKVSPPPFCILDEVDAMLDESNVGRFIEVLRELSTMIQVVIITHNRNTVQAANVIYGVTMGRDSTSQMISLKLEDIGDNYFE